VLDITDIHVSPRNFRNSSLFLLLAKTVRPLDVFWLLTVFAKVDIFRKFVTSFKQILHKSVNFE